MPQSMRPFPVLRAAALAALVLLAAPVLAADVVEGTPDASDMRLLRTPDIHGDTIVFGYAGDLWTVPSAGGEARRLTSGVGYERSPKFSPTARASPSRATTTAISTSMRWTQAAANPCA